MNPLMSAMQQSTSNMAPLLKAIQAYKNGTLDEMAKQELQNNPQFRAFVQKNIGKSQEQIAQENGIDLSRLKSMM